MDRVKGKVAIVTGGAKGIGAAAASRLAAEGASVAITDISRDEEQVAEAIRKAGGRCHLWHMDTTNEDEVRDTIDAIAAAFGHIDVLVNNAGIAGVNKPTDQISAAEWDEVMNVNVRGVFFCTKHVIAHMKRAGGGSIINLSSIYGLVGAADNPPYHASKGAVRLMSKTDAMLYARDRIRVNSIHPGYIWTPMVQAVAHDSGQSDEAFRAELAHLHPLGHIGEPDDIAWAVVYLASDESRFMTGAELVVDGGYTAR
ncbi:MAG: SDR family NAD(P)-dependent oxidoreductase [Asticcacaulis sp.]|uniref:SDR family NAD(P)-dependent oxidoreductase n=1 Tax=Asticcacaulis sp. TaxID=1872648 RepID=UPI003F7BFCCB